MTLLETVPDSGSLDNMLNAVAGVQDGHYPRRLRLLMLPHS